jgi:hypothetical protein
MMIQFDYNSLLSALLYYMPELMTINKVVDLLLANR